ncbi:HDOD domain-containing protein [bacterium]|nr:HDOD domain-containing protein [bacterium]
MSIRSKIKSLDKIAPLPTIAQKVLGLADDFSASAQKLGELIKMDQALTGRILRVANSSFFGFSRKIGNVDLAVAILGFNEVTMITLASCLANDYSIKENPHFPRREFWMHSIGTGQIARKLSDLIPDVYSNNAFVAGLLHDFGKVVLNQFFPDEFSAVLRTALEQKRSLNQVSKELLKIDHTEIGQMIIEEWNLPPTLIKAIRFHHDPHEADEEDYLVHITHLANILCHHVKFGISGNPLPDKPCAISIDVLGLKDKDLDEIWSELNVDLESIKTFL